MIKVRVPATSANLGPGFDTLGLALNLYNTYIFEEIESGLEIVGCEDEFCTENNMIYDAMIKTFEIIGYEHKGIKITTQADIPISRGLGSSAACIVAGVVGANKLAGDVLNEEQLLEVATMIEGHPDNVAPALLGGLVVSVMVEDKVYYNRINVSDKLKFVALVPDFRLSTTEARAVLPKELSMKEAVFNVSRASLLVSALSNNRLDLLKLALEDKFHQNYRGKLIKNYFDIVEYCEEKDTLGVYLSGAGPTIMVLIDEEELGFISQLEEYLSTLENNWEIKVLEVDTKGTI